MIMLGKNPTLYTRQYDEMLRYCTAALEGCRQLGWSSNLPSTKQALDCTTTYTSLLERIAQNSMAHREQALDLATRFALLQTMLGWRHVNPSEAVVYAQRALALSKETGNILLLLRAYSNLNLSYIRTRRYGEAREIMQESEELLKSHLQAKKQEPLVLSSVTTFLVILARHKSKAAWLLVSGETNLTSA